MINFDKLPTEGGNVLPPVGWQRIKIEKAEMKAPANGNKPYLNLTVSVSDIFGKSYGRMFDANYDSDKPALQYKLAQFIRALELPIKGNFELKDLCKIVVGRECVADIIHETNDRGTQAKVEPFKRGSYWPLSKFRELVAADGGAIPPISDAEVPFLFNAPDSQQPADDAGTDTTGDEY